MDIWRIIAIAILVGYGLITLFSLWTIHLLKRELRVMKEIMAIQQNTIAAIQKWVDHTR